MITIIVLSCLVSLIICFAGIEFAHYSMLEGNLGMQVVVGGNLVEIVEAGNPFAGGNLAGIVDRDMGTY